VKTRTEQKIVSSYKGESFAWLIVHASGGAKIARITHTCWKGKGALYGHGPGEFRFDGAILPFRMMLPRNFDPRKKYPLVISVSGSGGVGDGNVRSMEKVIFAKSLFVDYLDEKEFECISVVPQIPSGKNVPKRYWPKGPLGKPTPIYHPDWPAVNENGWYVQATIALIKDLAGDSGPGVDPDRIYFTGFSYGGKACWEFLRADRELFAGAVCGAGWPIGRARSRPVGPLKARLKLEVSRIKHIPVSIFAGQDDLMRYGSKAAHEEIVAQGGKSSYVEFPKTDHVGTARSIWRNRKYVRWLFAQNRKKNPKPGPDPYPMGVYDK
jgi:predicted peptidase